MCIVYSSAACQCNGHSQCVNESVCEKCEDLTTGRHCESCISGFYGDPTNGGSCQREYPRAIQSRSKSSSQSLRVQLHLTWQYFTVRFYVSHFPDSCCTVKRSPGILKIYFILQLILTVSQSDNKSIVHSFDSLI